MQAGSELLPNGAVAFLAQVVDGETIPHSVRFDGIIFGVQMLRADAVASFAASAGLPMSGGVYLHFRHHCRVAVKAGNVQIRVLTLRAHGKPQMRHRKKQRC